MFQKERKRGRDKMGVYTIKGNAIVLHVKAESREAAEKIIFAPLAEIYKNMPTVWFEHK